MAVDTQEELDAPQKGARREPEPRVLTIDVQRILRRVVRPDLDDSGESVVMLAQRADTSARTIYRILANTTDSISLDLADRCCLAADSHLMVCRLVWPDGRITNYLD
jgi:hypothetical protein